MDVVEMCLFSHSKFLTMKLCPKEEEVQFQCEEEKVGLSFTACRVI
jgi:hypothetical protein